MEFLLNMFKDYLIVLGFFTAFLRSNGALNGMFSIYFIHFIEAAITIQARINTLRPRQTFRHAVDDHVQRLNLADNSHSHEGLHPRNHNFIYTPSCSFFSLCIISPLLFTHDKLNAIFQALCSF